MGWDKLKVILQDIKFQHSIFALPFALMSAFLAAQGIPPLNKLLWILVAMVSARSSAMAFNRMVDFKYDQLNPRTQAWALPAGQINLWQYGLFLALTLGLFFFACYSLNSLAFYLAPVAIAIIFFYSFTKRLTYLNHLFLGLALGIAPVGAWIAIREELSIEALLLSGAVLFWVAGFDIIYSLQDAEFDKSHGLHSIPVKFGQASSLQLSAYCHVATALFLILFGVAGHLGVVYGAGVVICAVLLWVEHALLSNGDPAKINTAFFTINGWIGILLLIFTFLDIFR